MGFKIFCLWCFLYQTSTIKVEEKSGTHSSGRAEFSSKPPKTASTKWRLYHNFLISVDLTRGRSLQKPYWKGVSGWDNHQEVHKVDSRRDFCGLGTVLLTVHSTEMWDIFRICVGHFQNIYPNGIGQIKTTTEASVGKLLWSLSACVHEYIHALLLITSFHIYMYHL